MSLVKSSKCRTFCKNLEWQNWGTINKNLQTICLRERMFICQICTSDTKEFHFHKRDFYWLIRNFEYSWKRTFTSDSTHEWWRERNVSESTVGYRRWYIYERSLSWLGTDAWIKTDGVKLVYGVKPPFLVKWCGHLIMFFLNV